MEAEGGTIPLRAGSTRALAAARSIGFSTVALGTLVFVATWGGIVEPYTPPNIDSSLHAALNLAAVRGLEFGPDLVFTYGPLGFLKSGLLFEAGPARLAAIYGISTHLALAISLVWALRRNFPVAIVLVLALVIAVLARGEQGAVNVRLDATVIILAFIWCVAAMSPGSPEWTRRIVVYGGGPFAALELMTKLNTGVIVLALVATTVVAIPDQRWRNLAAATASFGATTAVLWIVAGQGLGSVGPYVTGSLEVISGYSSGARLDWGTRGYDYLIAPVLVTIGVLIAWSATQGMSPRYRAAILGMVAVVAFTAVKAGFVSHDQFHMATFYATMLGVYAAFPLGSRPRLQLGALVALVAGIAAAFTTSFPGYPMTNPLENARNGAETVATLVDTGRMETEIDRNRAVLQGAYDVDPQSLRLLEGHTVHVDPSEASAAWAYELDWQPLPVFQQYVAWTEELDRRNAEAIEAAEGPDRILRQNLNALGRYPAFESPAAMVAMLCHFRPLRTTREWQVLGRARDRCGEPRPIGSAEAPYGTPIPIPSAPGGSVVFARAQGLEVSGLERLRALLVRALGRSVVFEGDPTFYVFIPGTTDELLLHAPRRLDLPPPFALAPNADEMTFWLNGAAADQRIEVDFYALPVEPWR